MKSFSELGVDVSLLKAVEEEGYSTATAIQVKAIPPILLGRDVMAAAQTGTGKTASFVLPVLQRLKHHGNNSMSPAKHPVRALILTPTRELAAQVHASVVAYGRYLELRSTVLFGGVPIDGQLAALQAGVEIIVATPGRFLDVEKNKAMFFPMLEFFVLDEADRMLDMGFLPDITRIVNLLPKKRQTLLFSATYSDQITNVAQRWLSNPVRVDAAPRNSLTDTIEHVFYLSGPNSKLDSLQSFFDAKSGSQTLVFCNTKMGANSVAKRLVSKGFSAAVIHGDRSQVERLATLAKFKEGEILILVATDVAARGLDIENLPRVINFDVPLNAEDYVHRVGRTGRAGSRGEAVTLVTDDDDLYISAIEKLVNLKIKLKKLSFGSEINNAHLGDVGESESHRMTDSALPNFSGLSTLNRREIQAPFGRSKRAHLAKPEKEVAALFRPPVRKTEE